MTVRNFDQMIGKTMASVTGAVGEEQMVFTTPEGETFTFFHSPDCCESVDINDIVGDLTDLVGSPLIEAEETSSEKGEGPMPTEGAESWTWTFYRFSTVKGTVTVRWLGESNGYYSESVAFSHNDERDWS